MKAKICKVCLKRRDGVNWRTFPNILPQLAWSDERVSYTTICDTGSSPR